ncbi:hypothetical protein LTR27_009819 [Elasticomyces elasticus]|nr:hypothetical protein LTR27_009819 [Elasticomyces elasticus]
MDNETGEIDCQANTLHVYDVLDENMFRLHDQGDDASRDESESIALTLLDHSDLPLFFRARACMILGCSIKPGYIEWAQMAVDTVQLGLQHVSNRGPQEEKLLRNAQAVLKEAHERYNQAGGYEQQNSEGDGEEQTVGTAGEEAADPSDGAIDVDRMEEQRLEGTDQGGQAAAEEDPDADILLNWLTEEELLMPAVGSGVRQKKKVCRVDSGNPERNDFQEFDKDFMQWVPLGTATNPAAVGEDIDMWST